VKRKDLKKGIYVRIKPHPRGKNNDSGPGWIPSMDKYLGRVGKIKKLYGRYIPVSGDTLISGITMPIYCIRNVYFE
jgi:hypothetical protein